MAVVFGAVAYVLSVWMTWQSHARVMLGLDRIEQALEAHMATITSTWTSGGIERSVTTTRADGETDLQHAERHQAAVAAALKVFPKDT